MKKAILLSLIVLLLQAVSCSSLLGIRYSYAPLFGDGGGEARYSVYSAGENLFLTVTLSSDGPIFLSESPSISFLNFDGERLALTGVSIGASASVISYDETKYVAAQFRVLPNQIIFFKSGIRNVQITTAPILHNVYFRKDRIGKLIYHELLNELQSAYH